LKHLCPRLGDPCQRLTPLKSEGPDYPDVVGMAEAGKQFRKVNGFLHVPVVRKALEPEVAKMAVTPPEYDQDVA
jgi:hypothetical protein